ncbi:hypothetical protein [Flavihumibacter sp. UBA7668]|uniref:hypothetical protein n=1 Tax=Flavihumibacter sp. UBA7668 TaxID=1946542 RepID=UPI0025C11960|nr:hypothetical protein [Flavihumibacter sp. UBA7668]
MNVLVVVICSVLMISTGLLQAQESKTDKLLWSSAQKLHFADFQIKTAGPKEPSSNAVFSITYKIGGKELFSSNLNKRVLNEFIRSESWIDTTQDVQQALRYQQTSFDLCEVYVRQFRKALYDNKPKIKRLSFVDVLNETYTNAYSKRRLVYDQETKAGTDLAAQEKWETVIKNELDQLKEYAVEK